MKRNICYAYSDTVRGLTRKELQGLIYLNDIGRKLLSEFKKRNFFEDCIQ